MDVFGPVILETTLRHVSGVITASCEERPLDVHSEARSRLAPRSTAALSCDHPSQSLTARRSPPSISRRLFPEHLHLEPPPVPWVTPAPLRGPVGISLQRHLLLPLPPRPNAHSPRVACDRTGGSCTARTNHDWQLQSDTRGVLIVPSRQPQGRKLPQAPTPLLLGAQPVPSECCSVPGTRATLTLPVS